MNAHYCTSDLYRYQSPICAPCRLWSVLGRETTVQKIRRSSAKLLFSKCGVFKLEFNVIPLETWSIKLTYLVIVVPVIQPHKRKWRDLILSKRLHDMRLSKVASIPQNIFYLLPLGYSGNIKLYHPLHHGFTYSWITTAYLLSGEVKPPSAILRCHSLRLPDLNPVQ